MSNPVELQFLDLLSLTTIPPLNALLLWESQISRYREMVMETLYVNTNVGNFTYESIKHLIRLHYVKEIRQTVTSEIDWFNEIVIVLKP